MADNTFEILIKYGLDSSKAREAAVELRKLEDTGKSSGNETAKAAENANAKFKDVKKSVELVGGELGQVGNVLRYVFNPAILGAAVLAKGIGSVLEAFRTFAEGLKQSSINAARSVGNIKQAMMELDVERAKADVAFKTSMEDFERQGKRRVEVINLEKDAVIQLLDAREKSELATAKSPEEQAAIKGRYDSARQGAIDAANEKEIAAREKNLNEKEALAKKRIREGYAASGGRTPDRVKLNLKKMPGELASLDEQIAAGEKIVEDLSGIETPAGAFPYWNDPENYKTQLQTLASSRTTLQKLKQQRRNIANSQLPMERANAAYDAGIGLMDQVRTGREDLANVKTDSLYKNQTRWRADAIASGHGQAGELVAAAAAGAEAVQSGSKATRDQAMAIAQATQLLRLSGQSNETILKILSKLNDNQTNFEQSLRTLEHSVKVGWQRP